jgi:hypothetical protein
VIAHPRHRQVGERLVVAAQPLALAGDACHLDQVAIGEHGALGRAGGARRVADHRGVVGAAGRHLVVEVGRTPERELLPPLLQLGQAEQPRLGVGAHAARVVVHDHLEPRAVRTHGQQLVDLLLILRHRKPRLGVIDDVGQLLLVRVLVERHRDAAERLRGQRGPVERRPVIAHDRGLVAPDESERGQAQGEAPAPLEVVTPGVRLPDAEVLLANGDAVAESVGVVADELGERVERRGLVAHRPL